MTAVVEPIALGGDVSNDGASTILTEEPYVVSVTIVGACPILFHRYSVDSVEAKTKAPKGSAAKKTDDVESYVWRDESDLLCIPGLYLVRSLVDKKNGAAKYRQDPRSPRKSALDLWTAGVLALTDLAPIHRADGSTTTEWDYLDRRRVVVQQAAVPRERPAFAKGWSATVELLVNTPEYISQFDLLESLTKAGRMTGVGDFRPTFGRFQVTNFVVSRDVL